jgi:tetratricopeptide (TPR) repeat protein
MNQKQRNTLLEEALTLHKSHQHDEAERLYAKVRRECPRDFDAWFLSGAMAFQRGGHLDKAAELLEKARSPTRSSAACFWAWRWPISADLPKPNPISPGR